MKVLVCYKWVIDEADIIPDEESHTLNTSRAKYKISEIDRNAIELGVTLKEQTGCELQSLTIGKETKASLKDALSRGIDNAFYVETASEDSMGTAKVMAAAIKKLGDIDIIICGEGSSDNYSQQIGPRIAGMLGFQLATYASAVNVNEHGLEIIRKLEDDIETLYVKTPAVITVVSDINTPKVPGMKQILSARRKPTVELKLTDLGLSDNDLISAVNVVKEGPSIMDRKQVKVNENGISVQEAAQKLIQLLKNDKVI